MYIDAWEIKGDPRKLIGKRSPWSLLHETKESSGARHKAREEHFQHGGNFLPARRGAQPFHVRKKYLGLVLKHLRLLISTFILLFLPLFLSTSCRLNTIMLPTVPHRSEFSIGTGHHTGSWASKRMNDIFCPKTKSKLQDFLIPNVKFWTRATLYNTLGFNCMKKLWRPYIYMVNYRLGVISALSCSLRLWSLTYQDSWAWFGN